MPTNQQIIDRALYELGFHEYGASADSTDSGDALNALNDMMSEWEVRDINLNWFTQDTLGDTIPLPKWAVSGVQSNLAMVLGSVFNIAVSRELARKADEGKKAIANVVMNLSIAEGQDMSHMNRGEGHYSAWDIETDSI